MNLKNGLGVLLLCFAVSYTFAQDTARVNFGIKAAYGFGKFTSTKDIANFSKNNYLNYSAGLFVQYNIIKFIGVKLEVNYAMYGTDNLDPTAIYSPASPILQTTNEFATVEKVDLLMHTAEAPLMLKFNLPFSDSFNFFAYGGANFCYEFYSAAQITKTTVYNDEKIQRTVSDNIGNRIKSFEIAPIGGIGSEIGIGKNLLIFDARYKYGLQNINNTPFSEFYNNSFWFSLGFAF